jgi:hypothetical protein
MAQSERAKKDVELSEKYKKTFEWLYKGEPAPKHLIDEYNANPWNHLPKDERRRRTYLALDEEAAEREKKKTEKNGDA